MRRPLALLVSSWLTVIALGPAHADCPASTFLYGSIDPSNPIVKVAARVDTLFSLYPCDGVHARYDVQAGLVIASIDHACVSESFYPPSGLETVLEDDFVVVGLPPGTPAPFNALLHVRGEGHNFSAPGFGSGGARLTATLREGASNSTSLFRVTNSLERDIFVSQTITLPIAGVAGTPLHLRIAVRTESLDGRAELEGLLEITGLPPGAGVVSCRGYSSAAPVDARRTTWGRLKATYR